jgi:DNA-binding MarR family transcriptional regulator
VPTPAEHAPGTAEVAGVTLAPELTRYLPYLMRRAFVYVNANPDRSALARDFAVLASLADQNVSSQYELAERLEINRTTMVKLLDRLQEAGYVARTRNPDNRRSYLVTLTSTGKTALLAIQRSVSENDNLLTSNLTDAEHERLNDLLCAVLGEPERTSRTSSTGYLITQVFYLLRNRGDAMVSHLGLRIRNFAALSAIDTLGPGPQQQLARYLAVTEPAAAQIMEELVQGGLVARGQDPQDRRRYALKLTDLGYERLATLRGAMDHLQADVVKALGGTENETQIHTLLLKLLPANTRQESGRDQR